MVAVKGRLTNMVISRLHPAGDGDIIVPQRKLSIIGSTQWLAEDPDRIEPPAGEVERLIGLAAEMVPAFAAAPLHAVWSAVRPLVGTPGEHGPRSLSRDFALIDHEHSEGLPGLLTILGGKGTTLRAMAQTAADEACRKLGLAASCRTAEEILPTSRSYFRSSPGSPPSPASEAAERSPLSAPAPPARPSQSLGGSLPRVEPPPSRGPRNVTVRLYRFRPGQPQSARYDEATVAVEEGTTVLEVLETLAGGDPSLMFRHSCHHASCGTCACRINGRERLACTTRILELESETVTVEPLGKLTRRGDLVVEPADFFRDFPPGLRTLRTSDAIPGAVPPEELTAYSRLENCIECGACVSACPVDEFLGPAVLAALNREQANRPDSRARMLELAGGDRGAARCRRALECSRVCPAGVYPARHIEELRRDIGKQG
jgi:succinate dehydrogenase / fumarate reductase iron-sulfur subunit